MKYLTKSELYKKIDALAIDMGIRMELCNYPLDSKKIAMIYCKNPMIIDDFDFKDFSICGLSIVKPKSTTIFLNKEHTPQMQNFNCMHEMIHYLLHGHGNETHVNTDEGTISQSSYLEWQANEGAAQFLAPYQLFIPKYAALAEKYENTIWDRHITRELCACFDLSERTILNRISNLEYEIMQYQLGTEIDRIDILSKTGMEKWFRHV